MMKSTNHDWPEQVPYFDKSMIHQEGTEYELPDGRRCVVGWLQELFLYPKTPEGYGGYCFDSMDKAVKEFRKHAKKIKNYASLEDWGDDPKTPLKEIADTLNKTMVGLGYTEHEEVWE